jgi:hypothetical protein
MMQESNDAGDQETLQNSIDRCHSFVDKCVGNPKSFIHQSRVISSTFCRDMGQEIYNRIIEVWYVVHVLQMPRNQREDQ